MKKNRYKIVPPDKIPSDARSVPTKDLIAVYRICLEMQEICERENGVGLSAVQIGIPWQLFIIKKGAPDIWFGTYPYAYFIDCRYEAGPSNPITSVEGCLSLRTPNGKLRFFEVKRHEQVRVYGKRLATYPSLSLKDIDGWVSMERQSIVFQHEIDHAHGILISDHGKEVFLSK